MKRLNNAQRIINMYITDSWLMHKGDKLRLADTTIYDKNTPIGFFKEIFSLKTDGCDTYLILSAENYKSNPNWKRHKKELASAANEAGILVIFVPQLDMFDSIGEPLTEAVLLGEIEYLSKKLIDIAKYSNCEKIKSASVIIDRGDIADNNLPQIVAYSYNQKIFGDIIYAEDILQNYIMYGEYSYIRWLFDYTIYSLLEPNYHCLSRILQNGIYDIGYYQLHWKEWNTEYYIQLVNDIQTGDIRSLDNNQKISYAYCKSIKSEKWVDKFYKELEDKKC